MRCKIFGLPKMLCNLHGNYVRSDDLEEVTCKRCLRALREDSTRILKTFVKAAR